MPSFVETLLVGPALASETNDDQQAGDLFVRGWEALARNPSFALSDALSATASQEDGEGRRAARASYRLATEQATFEADQVKTIIAELGHPQPPSEQPQQQKLRTEERRIYTRLLKQRLNMRDFLEGQNGVRARVLNELQGILRENEALLFHFPFLGHIKKVCIRRNAVGSFGEPFDWNVLQADVGLIAQALQRSDPPSDVLDSEFPVNAAVRLQKWLGKPYGRMEFLLAVGQAVDRLEM